MKETYNFTFNQNTYNVIISRKNNKYTYLRIDEDGTLRISTNKFTPRKKINQFIIVNIDKIDKSLHEIKEKNELSKNQMNILGNIYKINYDNGKGYSINNNIITIRSNILDNKINLVEKLYKDIAYDLIPKIFYEVFNELNLSIEYPQLQIRKMKTRWGVCHINKNKIVLNSNLIKYKEEVIRYVMIHELMHFFIPNHSKEFWKLVSKYVPNYKLLRKELKN